MISMAEVKLRAARETWEEAKKAWQQALADVNVARSQSNGQRGWLAEAAPDAAQGKDVTKWNYRD